MLLQHPCPTPPLPLRQHRHHEASLLSSSASISHSPPLSGNPHFALPPPPPRRGSIHYPRLLISCSISQVHSYGTLDYERRPMIKWNSIYRRISLMPNPDLGSASVLNQCEKEGKKLTKWELCRVVKELRKYKRFKQALEVYDWMNGRENKFRLSASDAAIQLDLIAKVRGVSIAENFFTRLPDTVKDRRVYGALLNAYVRDKLREKAESLIDRMRTKGYATHPLPFNVMMTLYMNLKEYDKVELMVSEMMDRRIQLDVYSYNIWLSSRGSQGSAEKMEQVFEQMKLDRTINPNWTTFSTMATMYIKMGLFEKAEECLRKVESRITGRDRIPFHYLLSLYGNVGNKEEVYRIWNNYKSIFPSIPNLGYHAIISSLVRMDDIEGAEKMYDEWLLNKSSYDPRIVNLIMSWYVKNGNLDNAESYFEQMTEMGGKPNPSTWEILAEGHIREGRTPEALSCLKDAFASEGSRSWKPKPMNVSSFFKLCDKEADMRSKEELETLLMESGYLEDRTYASLIGLSVRNDLPNVKDIAVRNDLPNVKDIADDKIEDEESDGSKMLLTELQGGLC